MLFRSKQHKSIDSIAKSLEHLQTLRNVHVICTWDPKGAVRRNTLINKMKHSVLFQDYDKLYSSEPGVHYVFQITKPFLWAEQPELTLQALAAVYMSGMHK